MNAKRKWGPKNYKIKKKNQIVNSDCIPTMEAKQLLKTVVHLKQSMMEIFSISSWLAEVVALFTKDANAMVHHFVGTNFELMKFEKLFDAANLFTQEQFANDPEIMVLLYRSSFMGGVIDAHFDQYTKVEREKFIQNHLFQRWKKQRQRRAKRLYRRGGVVRSDNARKIFKFPHQKKKKKQKHQKKQQKQQEQQHEQQEEEQLLNQPSTSAAAFASLPSQRTSQEKQLSSKPKRLHQIKEERAGSSMKKQSRARLLKQAKPRERQPLLIDNDISDWEDVPTEDEITDDVGMKKQSNAYSTDENYSACETTDDDDCIPPVKGFDIQKRKYNGADDDDNQPSTSSKMSK